MAMAMSSPGGATARYVAEMDMIPISANFVPIDFAAAQWQAYADRRSELGRPADPSVWRICRNILVTDSDAQAEELLADPDGVFGHYFRYLRGVAQMTEFDQEQPIEALNAELAPFRVLTGLEVDILVDGSLDLSEEMLARLDLVVASVHSKFRMPADEMTRRMVMAVASPHVDVLGHMTNRKVVGGGRAPSDFDAEIVFAACAQFGTAVEINCRPERQDPPDELLALAVEWDCMIAINTDAHAPGQLEWQAYGCDKAARHGIEADQVINTMGADDLIAWAGSTTAA